MICNRCHCDKDLTEFDSSHLKLLEDKKLKTIICKQCKSLSGKLKAKYGIKSKSKFPWGSLDYMVGVLKYEDEYGRRIKHHKKYGYSIREKHHANFLQAIGCRVSDPHKLNIFYSVRIDDDIRSFVIEEIEQRLKIAA